MNRSVADDVYVDDDGGRFYDQLDTTVTGACTAFVAVAGGFPPPSVLLLNPTGVTNSGRDGRTAGGACNTASKARARCPRSVGAVGQQSLGERASRGSATERAP